MSKTNDNIKYKGNPTVVEGECLREGQRAPSFVLSNEELRDVTLEDLSGKKLVISVVPSLDTPVCAKQTQRFGDEAKKAAGNVVMMTVSRDLPFAQKRWCDEHGVKGIVPLSDYKYRTFGRAFGVEMPETGLLARAVFVVDEDGLLRYVQYVDDIANEPDYQPVLDVLEQMSG